MNIPATGPYSFTLKEGHRFSGVDKKLHSVEDAPAIVYADGSMWWYENDKIHRGGDKPAIIWWNGVEEYWQNNQRHRDNGPAVIFPDNENVHPMMRGVKQWWTRGRLVKQEKS